MEKFKVKKKHLIGEIADFPKRVVQAMVDEQVRQGNPADPSVFAGACATSKSEGGFSWYASTMGFSWIEIIQEKKFYLVPKKQSVEPNAIIQNMLDKGMVVWVCVSDNSYDDARANIGYYVHRVMQYDADNNYPVLTLYTDWKYAVPIDTATMTEITEVPK